MTIKKKRPTKKHFLVGLSFFQAVFLPKCVDIVYIFELYSIFYQNKPIQFVLKYFSIEIKPQKIHILIENCQ